MKAIRGFSGDRKAQSPSSCELGLVVGSLAVTYFHMANATLSSARRRFTVLFGMGRRGPTSLWPPDINWNKAKEARHRLVADAAVLNSSVLGNLIASCRTSLGHFAWQSTSNDRIKPHEQLVSVSLTPHSASTPDLSTSWSRTTLQEGLALREVSSSGEFRA